MKNYWETNDESHATIGLTESEVNTIINGMIFILSQKDIILSNNAETWYTHVKNLFKTFKEDNF